MSSEVTVRTNGGISFFGLLTIVFIVLKLTGYIDWSWWLVLAPIWGPLALVLSVALLMFLVGMVLEYLDHRQRRRWRQRGR